MSFNLAVNFFNALRCYSILCGQWTCVGTTRNAVSSFIGHSKVDYTDIQESISTFWGFMTARHM